MFHRLLTAVAAMIVAGGAHAESLRPIEGKDIDLGTMTGVVYYTDDTSDYRVVATLQTDSENPSIVRFVATLAPDQWVMLSTPRGAGEPASEVRFVRHGDQVFVDRGGLAAEAVRVTKAPVVR